MNLIIKEGDYISRGAIASDNSITFTFAGEKEDDCYILLKELKTGKITRINAPTLYCRGSLRSVLVEGISPKDYVYSYEINGSVILDKYARRIHGREIWMDLDRAKSDYQLDGGFLLDTFDWGKDVSPEITRDKTILYKLHMRGFTMDKGASPKKRGTFLGLIDKIPYLKALGVTAVEVMPCYEFEEMTIPVKHELPKYVKWDKAKEDIIKPIEIEELPQKVNFWGYGPGNYFAVKASYATCPSKASNELKTLIKVLHENQMEFVMEIYFPEQTNNLLILEALRFWVLEYHVDGFHLLGNDLPITTIATDAILSRTKLFYLSFDERIFEVRKHENLFIYKDEYQYPAKKVLNHINADMNEYLNQQRKQGKYFSYVNYITGNNGFTLSDLFMYNDRHNEANGEGNQDGNPWNFSNNQGVEGPSKKKGYVLARKRQWKNAWIMLLTAQSTPLLWAGDEFENSQSGNNNPYCQDNEIGWVNWKNNQTVKEDISFVSYLLAFRKNHPILSQAVPFTYTDYKALGAPDISLHGQFAWMTDQNPGNMAVGIMYNGEYSKQDELNESVYVAYNFYSRETKLALPNLQNDKKWYLVVDSNDFNVPYYDEPKEVEDITGILLAPQSICILVGK